MDGTVGIAVAGGFESMMRMIGAVTGKETRVGPEPITLGALIDKLAAVPDPEGKSVYYDFYGIVPKLRIGSYRGYYECLAIGVDFDRSAVAPTVKDLLHLLSVQALNSVFEGYKGGDYLMTRETPMWVGNYGECHSTAIVGVLDGWCVHLLTAHVSY